MAFSRSFASGDENAAATDPSASRFSNPSIVVPSFLNGTNNFLTRTFQRPLPSELKKWSVHRRRSPAQMRSPFKLHMLGSTQPTNPRSSTSSSHAEILQKRILIQGTWWRRRMGRDLSVFWRVTRSMSVKERSSNPKAAKSARPLRELDEVEI
ncbi:hypothetical protein BC829DRAFT_404326 [Chytridium lagenaria]|nr:hypothetical protein BC829DRAFT_404326 [Chytridium lagenaria]